MPCCQFGGGMPSLRSRKQPRQYRPRNPYYLGLYRGNHDGYNHTLVIRPSGEDISELLDRLEGKQNILVDDPPPGVLAIQLARKLDALGWQHGEPEILSKNSRVIGLDVEQYQYGKIRELLTYFSRIYREAASRR